MSHIPNVGSTDTDLEVQYLQQKLKCKLARAAMHNPALANPSLPFTGSAQGGWSHEPAGATSAAVQAPTLNPTGHDPLSTSSLSVDTQPSGPISQSAAIHHKLSMAPFSPDSPASAPLTQAHRQSGEERTMEEQRKRKNKVTEEKEKEDNKKGRQEEEENIEGAVNKDKEDEGWNEKQKQRKEEEEALNAQINRELERAQAGLLPLPPSPTSPSPSPSPTDMAAASIQLRIQTILTDVYQRLREMVLMYCQESYVYVQHMLRILGQLCNLFGEICLESWKTLVELMIFFWWPIKCLITAYVVIVLLVVVSSIFVQMLLAMLCAFSGAHIFTVCLVKHKLFGDFSLCRLPAASLFTVCLETSSESFDSSGQSTSLSQIVIETNEHFRRVANQISGIKFLPHSMNQIEISMRTVRNEMEFSSLVLNERFMQSLNAYIALSSDTVRNVQSFNVHIGTFIDWIILNTNFTMSVFMAIAESESTNSHGPLGHWLHLISKVIAVEVSGSAHVMQRMKNYQNYLNNILPDIQVLITEASILLGNFENLNRNLNDMQTCASNDTSNMVAKSKEISNTRDHFWRKLLVQLGFSDDNDLEELTEQLQTLGKTSNVTAFAIESISSTRLSLDEIQERIKHMRSRAARRIEDGSNVELKVVSMRHATEELEKSRKIWMAEEKELERAVQERANRW